MTPSSRLEITDLCKRYRNGTQANRHLSLNVQRGEVFGLLGPNGAGKSTLVQQIIGLVRPTSGSIHLNGLDLIKNPALARRLCSYLPQGALPIDSFRPAEIVQLVGRLRGGNREAVRERCDRLFEVLELDEWRHTPGARLSGGLRRLIGFVMTVIWPTPLVILDEPTNDIDPLRRRLLWREIRRLSEQGSAVLLVTHNVLEAEQAVDRLAVIDRGEIVAQGSTATLKEQDTGRLRLQLSLAPGSHGLVQPAFAKAGSRTGSRHRFLLDSRDAAEALEWSQLEISAGRAEEFQLSAVTLEDAYLRWIGRADAADLEAGDGS